MSRMVQLVEFLLMTTVRQWTSQVCSQEARPWISQAAQHF